MLNKRLNTFNEQIDLCLPRERRGLRRMFQRLKDAREAERPGLLQGLEEALEVALKRKALRTGALPQVAFSGDLPIHGHHQEIRAAISNNQVVIVCGETGSGKSTQLPILCLEMGLGVNGWIGHTQPRRLAARTIAGRISEELGSELGRAVGYKIRHTDKTSPDCYVKVMTDGILLSELQSDRLLAGYDTIIIDEAHERNLNIDFILGYLKRILPKRPDLRLIIASATIDVAGFSDYFNGAPVIAVSGRTYPVEVRYHPLEDAALTALSREEALLEAVTELNARQPGDILVFLEGEREIHGMAAFLRKRQLPDTDILPLYSRLSSAQQNAIFKPHQRRHIILATNVAETSLTIPAIHYVIDFGNARISRYSYRSKVQRLPIEKISQASANQRKGRCGRIAAGVCIRLYSEEDFNGRPAFTDAEILRTNLAAVILRMKALRLGAIEKFPFLEPPDRRYINDGKRLLVELGALGKEGELTQTGQRLSRLPVDPRFGRMLLAANDWSCLAEILIIVSALSVQDPRERPLEAQAKADEAHRQFNDERSDFLWFVNLWRRLFAGEQRITDSQLSKFCRRNFLSYLRMQEWWDIYGQLKGVVRELGYQINKAPADYNSIHRALLPGLLSQVAFREDEREYTGARGIKLQIFPGSGQFKNPPKWIAAAELAETSRLYARVVARIEPEWLLAPARHLLNSQYFEPFWDSKTGQVRAYEKVSLYGLVLIPKRKVNYGPIAPAAAREIFIRALADGRYASPGDFYQANNEIIKTIRTLEQKARRPDILNEEAIYDFYNKSIAENIYSAKEFERWRKSTEKGGERLLYLNADMIMYHDAEEINSANFPDILINNRIKLPVSYKYELGAEDDGITVEVPLHELNRIDTAMFERLVPGLLGEKISLLIKSLPKTLRKKLVPVPDSVRDCLAHVQNSNGPLFKVLSEYLFKTRGVEISPSEWRQEALPDYLRVNVKVVDDTGVVLAAGRDMTRIKAVLRHHTADFFSALDSKDYSRDGLTSWSFGDLPREIEVKHNGKTVTAYPAIIDKGDSVSLRPLDTKEKADLETHKGVHRLFMFALAKEIKYLRKHLPDIEEIGLLYASIGAIEEIRADIIHATVERAFLSGAEEIRTEQRFLTVKQSGQKRLISVANGLCGLALNIMRLYQAVHSLLDNGDGPYRTRVFADIQTQLAGLIYPGFIQNTPTNWLNCYPRYLEAIKLRLKKLDQSPQKDEKKSAELKGLMESYQRLKQEGRNRDMEDELQSLHWQLQELRVSLYAQELKTVTTVSVKRLAQQIDALRNH